MAGTLYVCATPIGNLDDMTFRVIKCLQSVDVIAAEDTRNSIKLLNHFEIKTPMTAYHEFNKYDKARALVQDMLAGKNVAITISGLPTRRFAFEAFLPTEKANKKERQRILEELRTETRTMIIYEAPHKLRVTLRDLADVLGNERRISLCRELTKKHEEAIRTTLGGAIALYQEEDPLGEYVLVIEGRSPESITEEAQANWNAMPLAEHMQHYLDQGMSEKDAMKAVAKDRGVSKRDIYNELKT